MSDTKHNLLHLLKIITAPLLIAVVVLLIIEIAIVGSLGMAGFKVYDYAGIAPTILEKWDDLP